MFYYLSAFPIFNYISIIPINPKPGNSHTHRGPNPPCDFLRGSQRGLSGCRTDQISQIISTTTNIP